MTALPSPWASDRAAAVAEGGSISERTSGRRWPDAPPGSRVPLRNALRDEWRIAAPQLKCVVTTGA
jgi:hypothetical protein